MFLALRGQGWGRWWRGREAVVGPLAWLGCRTRVERLRNLGIVAWVYEGNEERERLRDYVYLGNEGLDTFTFSNYGSIVTVHRSL